MFDAVAVAGKYNRAVKLINGGVEVALEGPRVDDLPAFLLHQRQLREAAFGPHAQFLLELPSCRLHPIFPVADFAFGS